MFSFRGGYSSVVLAEHKTTKRKVAIKIIDKAELIGNDMLTARVHRECDINLQISHLNIAKVYEIYESPEDICLAMELFVFSLSFVQSSVPLRRWHSFIVSIAFIFASRRFVRTLSFSDFPTSSNLRCLLHLGSKEESSLITLHQGGA